MALVHEINSPCGSDLLVHEVSFQGLADLLVCKVESLGLSTLASKLAGRLKMWIRYSAPHFIH